MGKKNTKQDYEDEEEDFEAQSESQNGQGGITDAKLVKYAAEYRQIKSEMDEIRGDLGAAVKQFEEDGGHKAALKVALKISTMESVKAQDFWRSLERYMHVLGVFDQHDLFDDAARPAKSEAKAAPKAPAIPTSATH